jgi:hypothetical protein
MTSKTTYRYTVQGRWPFPTDMLRRDRSEAASMHDEEAIKALSDPLVCHLDGVVRIRLVGEELPYFARWESFGWKVVNGDEKVRREMDLEAASKEFADRAAKMTEAPDYLDHDPTRAELVA